ncbi:hypothetical protein Tco_1490917 [Tanacetum coccineum]
MACQQPLMDETSSIDYDVDLDDVPIHGDIQGRLTLAKTRLQHSRTNHIRKSHFIRDKGSARLFKHTVSISPELAFDHYLTHDRAMDPLAPHYERKTRADRGKKRPRESNASSYTTPTSLFHILFPRPLVDENDDGSFPSNPSFFTLSP